MNYQKGLCSICCLAYKHLPYIEDCIKAIWNNDYKQVEIIVLDDGSNDGSIEKLKELQKISPCPFTIIEQENTGNVPLNFNRIFEKAHGEFISFMAIDDVLYPHAISEKMELMLNNPNMAFVANSKIMGIDENGNENINLVDPLGLDSYDNPDINTIIEIESNLLGTFYIQGTFFRTDIINTINAFDEDMTGDDIILRTKLFLFLQNNPQFEYKILKKPACKYRKHKSNIHKNMLRQIKIIAEYYNRYWPNKEFPHEFFNWIFYTIKNTSYNEVITMFSFSSKMKDCYNLPQIQDALKSKKRFEHKKLYDYIFRIEDYGIRKKIIIFNVIKITIKK